MTADVAVVDISSAGVLLISARPLRIGQQADLSMVLNGEPFAARVEVRRLDGARDSAGRWRAAAAFVNLAEPHRRALQQLLDARAS